MRPFRNFSAQFTHVSSIQSCHAPIQILTKRTFSQKPNNGSASGNKLPSEKLFEALEQAEVDMAADKQARDDFELSVSESADLLDDDLFDDAMDEELDDMLEHNTKTPGIWAPAPIGTEKIPPRPRIRKIDELGRAYGSGGRKNAKAYCWIKPGTGKYVVNKIPSTEYFKEWSMRDLVIQPFSATGTMGQFDVFGYAMGGGKIGQAGALRHAIANAMQNYDPRFRPTLKEAGLLERDKRIVERKHFGYKKARKGFTWVKR
jgi:small subunit ribosomal protein S9